MHPPPVKAASVHANYRLPSGMSASRSASMCDRPALELNGNSNAWSIARKYTSCIRVRELPSCHILLFQNTDDSSCYPSDHPEQNNFYIQSSIGSFGYGF
jgi:hypothetical protein